MKQELLARLSALGILPEKEAIDLMLSAESPSYLCDLLEERAKSGDLLLLTKQMVQGLVIQTQEKEPAALAEPALIQVSKDQTAAQPSQVQEPTQPQEAQNQNTIQEEPAQSLAAHKAIPLSSANQTLEVTILRNHTQTNAKAVMENFVFYFNSRYEKLRNLLSKRQLQNTTSIMHLKPGAKATVIGMVKDKRTSKNGHIMLELEDQTGTTTALIMKSKEELMKKMSEIVFDEVVAVTGAVSDRIMFADEITLPEIPINNTPKQFNAKAAVAFLSDIHVGSEKFLEHDFERFLAWTNGRLGSKEQKELAAKLSCIVIAGDVVDGIGVYPGQERELSILNLEAQFEKLAELLSQIPEHITIVLSPGNHDAVRLAQPQPPLDNQFTKSLDRMKNLIRVSNPAQISIHPKGEHPDSGLNVLIYHGTGFDGLIEQIPALKEGYSKPDLVARVMLQKRHLSPIYGMDVAAELNDNMTIDQVPDIFHSGHVHVNAYTTYRGVKIINSGCWQSQTDFQKMHEHMPTPARVPIFDFETSQVKQVNFSAK